MALKVHHGKAQLQQQSARRTSVVVVGGLRFFSKSPTPSPSPSRGISGALIQQSARDDTSTLLNRTGATLAGRAPFRPCHHVALLVKNLERSMSFYTDVLGLAVNPDRPHHKLPYRGAWLQSVDEAEMVHLLELDSPCVPTAPGNNKTEGASRDRHVCVGVRDVQPVLGKLQAAGVHFTADTSGRAAVVCFRDPDMNWVEVVEHKQQ